MVRMVRSLADRTFQLWRERKLQGEQRRDHRGHYEDAAQDEVVVRPVSVRQPGAHHEGRERKGAGQQDRQRDRGLEGVADAILGDLEHPHQLPLRWVEACADRDTKHTYVF